MEWVFIIVGTVAVLLIAFVAVGTTVGRLSTQTNPAIYDLNDAASWIAERLPDEVTARISQEGVSDVLRWHLDWFQEMGLASQYGQELATERSHKIGAVAPHEEAIDAVVARSLAEDGPEVVDVVCVLDLQMAYFEAIGAFGEKVDEGAPKLPHERQ